MQHRFTLKDRWGTPHHYVVDPHPPSRAHDLVIAIDEAIVGPGTVLLDAMFGVGVDVLDKDTSELVSVVMAWLPRQDKQELAGHIRSAISSIPPSMLMRFFEGTQRDGDLLGTVHHYDRAYEGNWVEWHAALWQIVRANGFIPFFSTPGEPGAPGAKTTP